MSDDVELAAKHWDEFTEKFSGRRTGLFWWEVPEVMREINRKISGDPNLGWLEYTASKHFAGKLPLDRCLSLGCGTGESERILAGLKVFRECEAYDLSEAAIGKAKEAAERSGYTNIHYKVADINTIKLERNVYEAVWLYGAMHHFKSLEHICEQIRFALKPAGLLAMNEYVGPARFQFPTRQKEIVNLCLQLFPLHYRRISDEAVKLEMSRAAQKETSITSGLVSKFKKKLLPRFWTEGERARAADQPDPSPCAIRMEAGFPTASDVIVDDPSESVRSHEILTILEEHFELVEKKEWGGNIPQFLLSGIAGNFTDEDACSRRLIEMIWKIEETLLECDELKSDFAYVVARPRK